MARALLGFLLVLIPPGAFRAFAQTPDSTRVVMLGTGTPNADPARSGPAVAIVTRGHPYVVDCGPGVVRRAAAARQAGVEALAVENLDIVFITHLHSDHTLGCPDLALSPWVLERSVPLRVYGPPGTEAMFDDIEEAWAADVANRRGGLQPHNDTGWRVEVTEVGPGPAYADDRVRVIAFAVPHAGWDHAYGYRFETADRTIVVSGDTGPGTAVADACAGCDVLVHEVYSTAGFARLPEEWRRYHADAHTSSAELAEVARRARPGLLVLTHQLFWGTSEEELLAEVTALYDGPTVSAGDLDVY